MRTLYFDCFAGASGDMTLGALVAAGADARVLIEQLGLLDVSGYTVDFEIVNRSGISAARAIVRTSGHEHHHRHLGDILRIIYSSRLADKIKERAAHIFTRLAEAEARVHNEPIERIHFHEVGALDAIVDVTGACIGFELLEIERFVSSPLHLGSGTVEMAHGRFPVPPPAVAELLREVPVYATDIIGELVTPTGAAIISTVCDEYAPLPPMRIERTGYGAGAREYPRFPNVLRVMVGTATEKKTNAPDEEIQDEQLVLLETNIDDASPQVLGYTMERAFAESALDCYFTPVQMKKNRPGTLVSILCRPEDANRLSALLFAETPTLGVRIQTVQRRALRREIVSVETAYGAIDVKIAKGRGGNEAETLDGTPEYEQCRAAAERTGVALRTIEQAARDAFREALSQNPNKTSASFVPSQTVQS